ncbi:ABC transporter family substrate-binding protein [Streptomyces jumonjinensis]|uniref:ABC transporter family substrate-binding protein n=1 Tax=Streptomyces jumonjinensis TaxID=1945 RepID=A0A646KQD3_STRJU|nr:ABC transporter family substrate-binding protein [Streptomyces jumonjinensis]MQT04502.1 ABC transporter family substrate-binding protein [Streptomyces jumonjinensis]
MSQVDEPSGRASSPTSRAADDTLASRDTRISPSRGIRAHPEHGGAHTHPEPRTHPEQGGAPIPPERGRAPVPPERRPARSPRALRSVALIAGGVLALPTLSGCASDDAGGPAAPQDIAEAKRDEVRDGGSLRWAIDAVPTTLNTFQADADAATSRVAGAVLPALFTLDERGRPQRNPDYVESAEIVEREPKQVVLYKLNQKAVWSDGREIGAPDFAAQWRALSGRDSAYWTARNAGYDRIEEIQKGANDLEVKVTFKKPYADWQSLFTPLYPKSVTGTPNAFNDGARTRLKATAGPFQLEKLDRKAGAVTLVRNPRWWGEQAKLNSLVLTAVPREKRAAALAGGRVDLAEIDRNTADRIALAVKNKGAAAPPPARGPDGARLRYRPSHGPAAALTPSSVLRSWALANGSDEEEAEEAQASRARTVKAIDVYGDEQSGLRTLVVRRSLEPAFTQLALNGESGPLSDDRVRRAVARALDREELAATVLGPLGLPAEPPGSHLALAGQRTYTDNSGALGEQNTQEAQALLADAGWVPGGALKKSEPAKAGGEAKQGAEADESDESADESTDDKSGSDSKNPAGKTSRKAAGESPDHPSEDGLYIVGDEPAGEPGSGGAHVLAPAPVTFQELAFQPRIQPRLPAAGSRADTGAQEARRDARGGAAGAYAPAGTAAPVAAGGQLGKNGEALSLRFVLTSGPGSESLRAVGGKIARMLDRIGIRTQTVKVPDESYFKDHVASGQYDLALYSWPATAYPATDARPVYAKPQPASDGSLLVEQNYTRVGTDYIDQLFDQAVAELDEDEARDLVRRADARIWAAAGSIPLYQRPELVAARPLVRNAGAFGFATPRYQDIGFVKPAAKQGKGAREPRETKGGKGAKAAGPAQAAHLPEKDRPARAQAAGS